MDNNRMMKLIFKYMDGIKWGIPRTSTNRYEWDYDKLQQVEIYLNKASTISSDLPEFVVKNEIIYIEQNFISSIMDLFGVENRSDEFDEFCLQDILSHWFNSYCNTNFKKNQTYGRYFGRGFTW